MTTVNKYLENRICPRCGAKFDYIDTKRVGGREYLYCVHVQYERDPATGERKKRKKKCYVGPAGQYEYVTRQHRRESLAFRGMLHSQRLYEYLQDILANSLDGGVFLERLGIAAFKDGKWVVDEQAAANLRELLKKAALRIDEELAQLTRKHNPF